MKSITVEELKHWKDNSENFQLIDVREHYEHESANINGEHIPMGEIVNNLNRISRDKKVVIHCKSGARSAAVTNALTEMGFSNVYNLEGGILAWSQKFDPSLMIL